MVKQTQELDFMDSYAQTRDFVDIPLKSGNVRQLVERVQSLVESRHLLFPDQETLLSRAVTGLLAGHIILAGPPGTGKTSLALILATAFSCSATVETATADWSTYDVIGGLQPRIEESGRFETIAPWNGHVTRAILHCARTVANNRDDSENHPDQAHWLIIDEFNRAEIDRAIGGLYTVLGSGNDESLKLWYEPTEERKELWIPGRFRIIGTLNSVDTNYVYGFSQGLTRRFRYVYVGVPTDDQVDAEVAGSIRQATDWLTSTYPNEAMDAEFETNLSEVAKNLAAIVRLIRYNNESSPGWPLGTAQVVDVIRHLALRARNGVDLHVELDLAISDLIVPQMMDLTAFQLDRIEKAFRAGPFQSMKRVQSALTLLREAQHTSFS